MKTARSIAAAALRHIASGLAGFLTIPLVAYSLGTEGVAAWALLGTAAFALGVSDLGLSVAVQRAAARENESELREAVGSATGAVVLVAPLLALVSFFGVLDLEGASPALRRDASNAAIVALIAGVIAAYGFPFRALVVVRGALGRLAGVRAVAAAVQIAVTWIWISLDATLLAPAGGLLVASMVETAALVYLARGLDPLVPIGPHSPTSFARARALLREGAASVTVNLAAILALRFDVVVLSRVAPLATVAAYGVAYRAVDQSFTLAKQTSTALMPRLARSSERARAIQMGTVLLGGVVACGMAALATRGDSLLVAWAGESAQHPQMAAAVALLGLAAAITAGHEVLASAVTLGGRSAWDAAIPLALGYAVNLAISLAAASTFGIYAVAGGTLAGSVVTSVLVWRRGRELLGWNTSDIARLLVPVAMAGLTAIGAGLAMRKAPLQDTFGALGAGVAGCAAAMAAGLLVLVVVRRKLT